MPLPDRRTFLSTSAAAVGTLALGRRFATGAEPQVEAPLAGRVRKAVKYHMIAGDASPLDKLELLKDLGFDGVEPRVSEKVDRKALRKASEKTGVKIHGVVNSSNPDIASAIDVAKYYGATSVLLVVPTDHDGSYLENYRKRQQLIRDAVPRAEKQGIDLLIENVWATFLIEPLSMARFVDELDSERVGVYFDVGNNIRWGHAWHWIEALGKRVRKLDIKEYSRKLQVEEGLRAGFNVEIGEGSVDWKRVRRELLKIDYEGWATAEVRGGDRERLADIAHRMDTVLGLSGQ